MEYFLTPNASKYYPTPLSQTIWRVDSSMQSSSLRSFYNSRTLGRFYNPSNQLNLPIFFITDADLGKSMGSKDLLYVKKRYLDEDSILLPATPFSLPETVFFPNEKSFGSVRHMFGDCLEKIKELANPNSLINPNCGIWEFDQSEASPDWLGLYRGYGSGLRAIFIRIDKIMEEPLLNNSLGVASVVLHELGHALMDANKNPRPSCLKFSQRVYPGVANLLYHILEESLANMIAYFGICKGYASSSPYVENIVKFMGSEQPFPYTLGVKFGEAYIPQALPQALQAERYVVRWYIAKKGTQIDDVSGWVRLIFSKSNFTSDDLKQQCDTLFGGKKKYNVASSAKKTTTSPECKTTEEKKIQREPIDATRLYVRGADPLGREGVTVNGTYTPFKKGYADRYDDKFVIAPIFDVAEEFSEDIAPGCGPLARVCIDGKWGIIYPDGTYFVEPQFNVIRNFCDGIAAVAIDYGYYKDWGFIKLDGSYLVAPMFDRVDDFRNGYANVWASSETIGFIRADGCYRLRAWSDIEENSITKKNAGDDINIVGKPLNGRVGWIDRNGYWHDNINE